MIRASKVTFFFLIAIFSVNFFAQNFSKNDYLAKKSTEKTIVMGADRLTDYLPLLKNKKVGVVANQASLLPSVKGTTTSTEKQYIPHLVDVLLDQKINITKIFVPEHGFRGTADAGESIKDGKDLKTGIPIVSLYGKNKKPTPENLKNVDIILFDLQDVGVRFYTYISTLHYIMEAGAENKIPLVVLDRPNPNCHYVDGPVLDLKHQSFVGMHQVPVVYGMTIGEYAKMINGEKWLKNSVQCDLTLIELENYTRNTPSSPLKAPSPNLPNDRAINLYPSLCFFEGTNVSVGRGTAKQFQLYGAPYLKNEGFSFTPHSNVGAKDPLYKGKVCYGKDLSSVERLSELNLSWLIKAFEESKQVKVAFFNAMFNKLAGNATLQKQIMEGLSEKDIKQSWQKDLNEFKNIRKKYLIYKD